MSSLGEITVAGVGFTLLTPRKPVHVLSFTKRSGASQGSGKDQPLRGSLLDVKHRGGEGVSVSPAGMASWGQCDALFAICSYVTTTW